MSRVVVTLKDGRTIDISDMTPEDGIAKLKAEGVALDDIRETTHSTRAGDRTLMTDYEPLYAVARRICHEQGIAWTDPRTGTVYPPPAMRAGPIVKRPLTAIEVDTIRVALELLLQTPAANIHLLDARATIEVSAIASDDRIVHLIDELAGADVDVRRTSP